MLNYSNIFKEIRTNNYLENFNGLLMKKAEGEKLQPWVNYIYLLKNVESSYKLKIIEVETNKSLDIDENNKLNNKFDINTINQNLEIKYHITNKWFKLYYSSCRYDTFSLLYHIIIDNYLFIENKNIKYNNKINNLHLFFIVINRIADDNVFLNGIWKFLETSKDNYFTIEDDLDKVKKDDILSPLFALLDGGLPICINFKKIFKCKKHLLLGQITQQYSKSLISFVEDNLLLKNINELILINYSYEKLPCE